MKHLLFILCLILFTATQQTTYAQIVFENTAKSTIYDYLDEMSNIKLIELNSSIKPYSRQLIAEKLREVNEQKDKLNKRQLGELTFFMRDYVKELNGTNQWDWFGRKVIGKNRVKFKEREKRVDLIYHKDSLFNITVNPIAGIQIWNNKNGMMMHRWNGAEMFACVGKHLGIYGNLRDNYESKEISGPQFLNQRMGGFFKGATAGFDNRDAREYSELRGGITYGWKWGYLGVVKESNVWGNNYNGSNILGNRNPSFAQIRLNIKPAKWFELNYFHGWLASKVIDSSRTQIYGTGPSQSFVPKYLAMNMFTLKPFRSFYVNIGNSIIYSRSINAGYLIPFIFFKSLDHTYNTLGNSQLFFDVSIRSIRKVHLYFTGYIDELSFGRMFSKTLNSNFWSGKAGIRLSNVIPNTTLTAEYTRTNPIAFQHYNPETTYESTGYNLGHYLRQNSQDIYFQIVYKPLPRLHISAFYDFASKGPDYPDNRNQKNPSTGKSYVLGLPFMESIIWQNKTIGGQLNYEVLNDIHIKLAAQYSSIWDPSGKYTPTYFAGKGITSSVTLCWGF
jgi:hypothetical protein